MIFLIQQHSRSRSNPPSRAGRLSCLLASQPPAGAWPPLSSWEMEMEMLAPELIHIIALGGHLTPQEVGALALTCSRMASILTHDPYGRNLHHALLGVVANVRAKHWESARYALSRGWYERDTDPCLWMRVAEVVVGMNKTHLSSSLDLVGWETVLTAALSLPDATGHLDEWKRDDGRGHRYITASLLHIAAAVGSVAVVELLLERGADVEQRDGVRMTPLGVACRAGHMDVVDLLVRNGASVLAKDSRGRSTLFEASYGGHTEVVRFLLGLGVLRVDDKDVNEDTPLDVACKNRFLDVVKVLVEEGGANVDVNGRRANAPLYWACYSGDAEIVAYLIESGAWEKASKVGRVWGGGMIAAAQGGYVDVVRMLLEFGVGANGVDVGGKSVLVRASLNGYADVVRILLDQGGVDVNAVGRRGATALAWASGWGKEGVVRVLLEGGADPGIVNDRGETPLDLARKRGWDRVVSVLEEWGAG